LSLPRRLDKSAELEADALDGLEVAELDIDITEVVVSPVVAP